MGVCRCLFAHGLFVMSGVDSTVSDDAAGTTSVGNQELQVVSRKALASASAQFRFNYNFLESLYLGASMCILAGTELMEANLHRADRRGAGCEVAQDKYDCFYA